VTIRAADGTVLRRTRVLPDGQQIVLIDDMTRFQPVDVSRLPEPRRQVVEYTGDETELRAALARAMAQDVGRSFSLRQIRDIDRVRYLAPEIEIDAITFATGSSAIDPSQAQELAALGRTLVAMIEDNPAEVFLIEGHTDAVGDAGFNLALSDRRAETVALALTEYFDVPPENLVVQGYGESDLKIQTQAAERENRRANVRRITGLLGNQTASLR
jgi:outer membrane protein OmpA-like peptidoglycan-associated protein